MKRVLFFGIFDPKYARTRILTEGFTALGYEVILCRADPRIQTSWRKYLLLWKQGRALQHKQFEHILVLFPGHTVVWLARILFGNRVIFDMFVSLFDSNVCDRARYTRHSIRAYHDHFLDWYSCVLAHHVLADTETHKQYFIEHLDIPEKKIITVPVGAAEAWFVAGDESQQSESVSKPILVGFYGSYIPLHGVEIIVQAAKKFIKENIHFRIIGSGQEYAAVQLLVEKLGGVSNIDFINTMPRDELIKNMREIDICLGIFGNTEKASRVIPNKVYECAALGKPIITADTQGIREVFTDKENISLCIPASSDALAASITELAAHTATRRRLGAAARALMQKSYTPTHIVKQLLKNLQ